MFSAIGRRPVLRSAAWRISLLGTLAFACGSLLVFVMLMRTVAQDIERRTDVWLNGELEKLASVAARTPADQMPEQLADEVEDLSHEVPERPRGHHGGSTVFFLRTPADGSTPIWVGDGAEQSTADALRAANTTVGIPTDVRVPGVKPAFRVLEQRGADGSRLFLGLSERDQHAVLRGLRLRFLVLWLCNVLLGFAVVFAITRRMLGDVRRISEAASEIGESDLSLRVPVSRRMDEVGQLALTLNGMLGRIESSVQQVHTMTNSLAHDLRSPLTAVRAKLELALTSEAACCVEAEGIESAIEEVDRLTEILTRSLDVAEAKVSALRMDREAVDLDSVLRVMAELYEPSFAEKGLRLELRSANALTVFADATLLHRMMANLFDNELKHLPAGSMVRFVLAHDAAMAVLLLEDDGPGFAADIEPRMFESGVRGKESSGYGLGLAFVEAVVLSHGGEIEAGNGAAGGMRMMIRLPLVSALELVG